MYLIFILIALSLITVRLKIFLKNVLIYHKYMFVNKLLASRIYKRIYD